MITNKTPAKIAVAPAFSKSSFAAAWAIADAKKSKTVCNDISEKKNDLFNLDP